MLSFAKVQRRIYRRKRPSRERANKYLQTADKTAPILTTGS